MKFFIVVSIQLLLLALQAHAFMLPNTGRLLLVPTPISSANTEEQLDEATTIENAKNVLNRAAETKEEKSDTVVAALLDLEKLMRKQNKQDPALAEQTLKALSGNGGNSWRLIFTTGTINTQQRTGRINYFPIKAVQSFNSDTDPWKIENGIYVGDFPVVLFQGDFDWNLQNSGVTKLTFDFTKIKLLNFLDISLKGGDAAKIGAASGLGSESNVVLEKQGKRAFFNWISADDKIATARGGGGGLALWKRFDDA